MPLGRDLWPSYQAQLSLAQAKRGGSEGKWEGAETCWKELVGPQGRQTQTQEKKSVISPKRTIN